VVGTPGVLLSSPLLRTRETAALVDPGAAVELDVRVIELDYGELDGTALDAVDPDLWERWISDSHFAPPGGESLAALSERVEPFMEEMFSTPGERARSRDHDVVVVSHVSPIKAAVAWALKSDPLVAWRLRLSTGSITRIAFGPAGPQLVGFNEVPDLS
jgi:probable phosphoglycerate mutase